MWIRAVATTEPIVEKSLFDAAQAILEKRLRRVSDEQMLDGLRQLLHERGHITTEVIDQAPDLPCANLYKIHSGE